MTRGALACVLALAPALAHADPGEAEAPEQDAPPPAPFLVGPRARLAIEVELFADAGWIARSGPDLTQFRLDRGETGATVGLGRHGGAEVRLESVRSAAEGGELGVAGDSLVMRVKRAQVFGDYESSGATLIGALGMTPDPWITALEEDDTARPISATGSERLLGWPTSDLAALGRVAWGPVRLTIAFGNGEGQAYPERNTGKTTTGVVEVLPLDTPDARLRVMAMARDGSLGPGSVRDRRFGGGATFASPLASAGVELVRAYGLDEVAAPEAWLLGGWAEVRPIPHTAAVARGMTIGYDAGGRQTSVGAALAVEPWRGPARGRMRLWLALDRTTSSGAAMPLPGFDPGDETTLMVLASTTAPFAIF